MTFDELAKKWLESLYALKPASKLRRISCVNGLRVSFKNNKVRSITKQDLQLNAYKNYRMRDKSAHDLVVRAVDIGAVTNRMIPAVLKEWREPSHEDFQDRPGWSLFNAFTEILKGNLPELPHRTKCLHALFDQQVKLSPAHLN
jgi:hypothetical protein